MQPKSETTDRPLMCFHCRMVLHRADERHPHAACMMFRETKNGNLVRAAFPGSVGDEPAAAAIDTPAQAAARAWLHAYGITTHAYTRSGGDHPAMHSLPQAFEAYAANRQNQMAMIPVSEALRVDEEAAP